MNWLLKSETLTNHGKEYIPAWVKTIVLSVCLSVLATITPIKSANWNGIENTQVVETSKPLEQVRAWKNILSLVSNILLNDKKEVSVTKNELNRWYNEYLKLRGSLWPNLEVSFKKFLYDRYIDLLEKWYEINGCVELDDLVNILWYLNNSINLKLSVKNDNPDFKDKITVIWGDKDWRYIISESNKWLGYKSKISFSSEDLYELLKAFESDVPDSFKQAMEEIAKINWKLLEEKEILRLANLKISELQFWLEQSNQSISNLKKDMKIAEENALKTLEKAKQDAENHLKEELIKLQNTHNKEKERLNLEKSEKDSNYKELEKQFEAAKKKAIEDAEKAFIDAEKKEQDAIDKLKIANAEEISLLNTQINNLNLEIENQKSLVKALWWTVDVEKDNLKLKMKELNNFIAELRNQITAFQNDIKSKDEEINRLKTENDSLLAHSTNNAKASVALAKTKDDTIRNKDSEIQWLKDKLWESQSQIEQLKKDKADLQKIADTVRDLEQKLVTFNNNLQKIQELETELSKVREQISNLEKSNTSLQWENTILKWYEKKSQEFDALNNESAKKSTKIWDLESINQSLESTIKWLKEEILLLSKQLDESKKRESDLISNIDANTALSETVCWTAKIQNTWVEANTPNSQLKTQLEKERKERIITEEKNKELQALIKKLEEDHKKELKELKINFLMK